MMPFFILSAFWRCIWMSPFSWLCKPMTSLQSRTDSRFSNGTCHLACLQPHQQEKKNCHHLKELSLKHSHLVQVCICVQETAVKNGFGTVWYGHHPLKHHRMTKNSLRRSGNLRAAVATHQQESWSYKHVFAVKYMQFCKDCSEHQGLTVFSTA